MNTFIRRAAQRDGRTEGLIDRLKGTPPLDADRQERLNTAMADYESAVRRGDNDAAAFADHQIGTLLDAARAERQPADNLAGDVGQAPAEPAPQFDGGVRRPVRRNREPLTVAQAVRAELASREEIRGRHQDNVRAWDRAARR